MIKTSKCDVGSNEGGGGVRFVFRPVRNRYYGIYRVYERAEFCDRFLLKCGLSKGGLTTKVL